MGLNLEAAVDITSRFRGSCGYYCCGACILKQELKLLIVVSTGFCVETRFPYY